MKNDIAMTLAKLGQLSVKVKEAGGTLTVVLSSSEHTTIDIQVNYSTMTGGMYSKIIYCDDSMSQSVYGMDWVPCAEMVARVLEETIAKEVQDA